MYSHAQNNDSKGQLTAGRPRMEGEPSVHKILGLQKHGFNI